MSPYLGGKAATDDAKWAPDMDAVRANDTSAASNTIAREPEERWEMESIGARSTAWAW
ncbi:hypothetical protein EK21DRAFT_119053 [Setomelanomma holmii]|uniref:Uncharacterized protein n=1 Tax=Setomelanomma holmii TaxID=210430 RepID=A0A9P4GX74_9PLEO|nr:hypothetical protein EK21DRAFT_119053 [Setomelanomma holmii]